MYARVVEIPGMNECSAHSISHYILSPSEQGSAVCSDSFKGCAGGGAEGL